MKKEKRMTKKTDMSKHLLSTALFLLCASLGAAEADAYNYNSPIDDSRTDYASGATRKLGRGLANTGLGWTEVFKGMQDVSSENGFWAGATWGPIYGTLNAVRRTAVGVFETATFPIKGPNQFDPVLEPEFPPLSDN